MGRGDPTELALLLPPERELELTTNPDRILELAPLVAGVSHRPAVTAARSGADRGAIVRALADEMDAGQQEDKRRVARYEEASREYFALFRQEGLTRRPLPEAHRLACQLAERSLPQRLGIAR